MADYTASEDSRRIDDENTFGETSALEGFESAEAEPKKKRRWPWVVGASTLVLAGVYAVAAYYVADKIPADTSVSGVPVGGLTTDQARDKIQTELADDLTQSRTIVAMNSDADGVEIAPEAIGLDIDYAATLDELTGFSLNPVRLWEHVAGGRNVDPVINVDDQLVADEVASLADHFRVDATDADLEISGTDVVVTPAETGVELDTEASRETLVNDWFAGGTQISLPTQTSEPALGTDAVQQFANDSVKPLLSGPISINVKQDLVELSPDDIASLVTADVVEGEPSVEVNAEELATKVNDEAGDVLTEPRNATIQLVNGAPQISESQVGESIDGDQLATDFLALASGSERNIEATIIEEEPELTTEQANELGIKEVVSEISTPLTSDNVRTTNLVVGSSKITNTLVLPGERFDLETELGPVNESTGFVASGVFVDGFSSTAMGGGLSQLATNVFNIGYRAGLVDIAHKPHSVYFERYPMGLESTIWFGQTFVTWENNTPYGVLVESYVSNGYLTTRLWSTKHFDVDVWQGQPYNYVSATTKHNPAADCTPSSFTYPGFTIDVGRVVKLNGETVEDSSYSWKYNPTNAVTCG